MQKQCRVRLIRHSRLSGVEGSRAFDALFQFSQDETVFARVCLFSETTLNSDLPVTCDRVLKHSIYIAICMSCARFCRCVDM